MKVQLKTPIVTLALLFAALSSGLLTAGTVSAETDNGREEQKYFIETWHETETCGEITIYLRNASPWIYPVSYSTDGTTPDVSGPNYGPVVDNRNTEPPFDTVGSKTLTFAEDENGGVVTVKYVVAAGTESDLYKGLPVGEVTSVDVITDCEQPAPEEEEEPVEEETPVVNVLGDSDDRDEELPASLPLTSSTEQIAALTLLAAIVAATAGAYLYRSRSSRSL